MKKLNSRDYFSPSFPFLCVEVLAAVLVRHDGPGDHLLLHLADDEDGLLAAQLRQLGQADLGAQVGAIKGGRDGNSRQKNETAEQKGSDTQGKFR